MITDVLSICRDCPFQKYTPHYKEYEIDDIRFCVHIESCRRAYLLLKKEKNDNKNTR